MPRIGQDKPSTSKAKKPISTGVAALKAQTVTHSSSALPNVAIDALAGTGKTTTIISAVNKLKGVPVSIKPSAQQEAIWNYICLSPKNATVALTSFGRAIADELRAKIPKVEGVCAETNHAFGNQAIKRAYGRPYMEKKLPGQMVLDCTGLEYEEFAKEYPGMFGLTKQVVSLCKQGLVGFDGEELLSQSSHKWDSLILGVLEYYGILVENENHIPLLFKWVPSILHKSISLMTGPANKYGMDDMVWIPVVLKLPLPKYDILLVDEYQDLNRCQQELLLRAAIRMVVIGDPRQAIYGFAGADAQSVDRMKTVLSQRPGGLEVLPLSVTYRCGKNIVKEAQKIVGETYQAHESNADGKVLKLSISPSTNPDHPYYLPYVKENDMVLCRYNAPLVGQFFKLLAEDKRVKILGKNIGEQLITLIKRMKVDTASEMLVQLEQWRDDMIRIEAARKVPSDTKIEMYRDQYECVETIVESKNFRKCDEVVQFISSMFDDEAGTGIIRLSSIHKAKGLEADNVFILIPTGCELPSKRAKTAWQKTQEDNLAYVAVTRAKKVLAFVTSSASKGEN